MTSLLLADHDRRVRERRRPHTIERDVAMLALHAARLTLREPGWHVVGIFVALGVLLFNLPLLIRVLA